MCFLKALKPLDDIPLDPDCSTDESSPQENSKNFSFSTNPLSTFFSFKAPTLSCQDQLLKNLMGYVRANSVRLASLHQKLSQNEQHLLTSQMELENITFQSSRPSPVQKTADPHRSRNPSDQHSTSSHPLVNKLFEAKEYEYRLEVQGDLPQTIFKERNINIPLGLVDRTGQKVLNSNIIHLCLGVCDANGEWITVNRTGENFMKGKTEIEMYHGEGSFLKVYPRDISRHYPEGKLSFVIYSKPSLIQFSSNACSIQKIVDSNLIEPLVISNIQIKAKKC